MRFDLTESNLGKFKTYILKDSLFNSSIEIAEQGATLLNFFTPIEGEVFNIIDGFSTEAEFENSRGARSWIMAPFSNRIENGTYSFRGKTYQIKPIKPRSIVIHGFTFYNNFKINSVNIQENFIDLIFHSDCLRPEVYEGYPFAVDVFISYRLYGNRFEIKVIGKNVGEEPAPFCSGWHPYFKTSDDGIENLILEINSKKIILIDENYIPLKGNDAYGNINNFPLMDFRKSVPKSKRRIDYRIIDTCFADLDINDDNMMISALIDETRNIKINLFQERGMVLAFSGDSLSERKRKSIAIEPVEFMTNAFNRPELAEELTIYPEQEKIFHFGVEVITEKI